MLDKVTVSSADLAHHLKMTCKIPAAVEEIVTRKIVAYQAIELGITVTPREIQQAADNFRLLHHLHDADTTWLWMRKHCLTLEEFEALVRANLLQVKLAQALLGDAVEPFFEAHRSDYTEAVLYEAIVDDVDLALVLASRISRGDITIQHAAQQYANDEVLKHAQGYVGTVRLSQLDAEVAMSVSASDPPQLLEPIITALGTRLIWVEKLIPARLTDALRQEILAVLFTNWLREQIAQVETEMVLDVARTDQPLQQLPLEPAQEEIAAIAEELELTESDLLEEELANIIGGQVEVMADRSGFEIDQSPSSLLIHSLLETSSVLTQE